MNDLVSVIIPSYNRFKFLCEALKSVQNQTYDNIEIIVINDASTEQEYYTFIPTMINSTDRLKRTITIIHLKVNMRIKHNALAANGLTRNEGMKIAKGKWIAFLDDDDRWLPNKLSLQISKLKEYPNIVMCSSNMLIKNNILYDNRKHPMIMKLSDIQRVNYINASTVVISKKLVDKIGWFVIGVDEDYEYWKRALMYTDNIYLDEGLIFYDVNHGYGIQYKK